VNKDVYKDLHIERN